MLNIPLQTTLILTDSSEMSLLHTLFGNQVDFSNHIDIRMLESQQTLNRMNRKVINSGYLPSLAFTGQYALQGMRREFKNYFNNSPENLWPNSSYIALSLSIPVFDGLEKRAKSQQAKTDYLKTEALLYDKKEKFTIDYQNAINNYQNNRTNVARQQQNIALAEKVYDETALRYREGLATMSSLLQDEMSLNSAQASYFTALYNYKEAEIRIMGLNGEIRGLIRN